MNPIQLQCEQMSQALRHLEQKKLGLAPKFEKPNWVLTAMEQFAE